DPHRTLVVQRRDTVFVQVVYHMSGRVVRGSGPDHRSRVIPTGDEHFRQLPALRQHRTPTTGTHRAAPGFRRARVQVPVVGSVRTRRSSGGPGGNGGDPRGREIFAVEQICPSSWHGYLRRSRGHAEIDACPWSRERAGESSELLDSLRKPARKPVKRTLTDGWSPSKRICRQVTGH